MGLSGVAPSVTRSPPCLPHLPSCRSTREVAADLKSPLSGPTAWVRPPSVSTVPPAEAARSRSRYRQGCRPAMPAPYRPKGRPTPRRRGSFTRDRRSDRGVSRLSGRDLRPLRGQTRRQPWLPARDRRHHRRSDRRVRCYFPTTLIPMTAPVGPRVRSRWSGCRCILRRSGSSPATRDERFCVSAAALAAAIAAASTTCVGR